jgi:hypothetical protein
LEEQSSGSEPDALPQRHDINLFSNLPLELIHIVM